MTLRASTPLFPLVVGLLTACSSLTIRAQEVDPIHPSFTPGKTYTYIRETVLNMPGQGEDAAKTGRKFELQHTAKFAAVKRKNNLKGVSLHATTEKLIVGITIGEKKLDYDSDKVESKNSRLARHFDSDLNRWLQIELDKNQKIVSSTEGGGGGSATPMVGLPQFGPEELKRFVSSQLQFFPPDPISPGDEWVKKGSRNLGQLGQVDFEVSCKYAADQIFEGVQCAIIDFTGKVGGRDLSATNIPGTEAGSKFNFKGDEMKGRLYFDRSEQVIRKSEQTVSMIVSLPTKSGAPVRAPLGQSITTRLVSIEDPVAKAAAEAAAVGQ